ncbi:MAG: hypothetical protein H7X99_02440 [Saprospiraceae bacterium]|nr:hypothetical protein [Saprospiraceae bacterium]
MYIVRWLHNQISRPDKEVAPPLDTNNFVKMKYLSLLLLVVILFLSNVSVSQTETIDLQIFSVDELKEDFAFWRNRIEQKHPLVYLYATKNEIDRGFDSLYQQIDQPMTELDFIKILSPITSLIQDGHTYVIPSEMALGQIKMYNYLFPLELKFINERLYVTQDGSSSGVPLTGMEITSINAVSSKDMLSVFLTNLGRDGSNLQHAYATINKSFRHYFHTYFGFTKEFILTYRTMENVDSTCVIMGKSLASIQNVRLSRYPMVNISSTSNLQVTHIDSIQTAVLRIQTFSPDASNVKFKRVISNFFESIEKSNVENLIIDLRDNGGGNPNLVKFILQHLFDESFEQAMECRIVQKSSEDIFSERTRKKWYPWYGIGSFKPKKNNFKGNLYVLVNEGTFSAGVIFSSVLRKYNRAVFVGNETGGNPIIMAGYLVKTSWKLPNTKIQMGSGTLCTIYDDIHRNQGRGLVPDYIVKPASEDILSIHDRCLHYTLEIIRDSN